MAIDPSLYAALVSGGKGITGMPSEMSAAPAPAVGTPLPTAGPSLYQAMVAKAEPQGPSGGSGQAVPDPDPRKAQTFVDTLKHPSLSEYWKNFLEGLGGPSAQAGEPGK